MVHLKQKSEDSTNICIFIRESTRVAHQIAQHEYTQILHAESCKMPILADQAMWIFHKIQSNSTHLIHLPKISEIQLNCLPFFGQKMHSF